jgi:hypothetical protein
MRRLRPASILPRNNQGKDMQGERHPTVERVVESMEHTMDNSAHGPEYCISPMDPAHSADLREQHTTQNRCTGTTEGSQHPTVLEVNTSKGRRTKPASRHQDRILNALPGKNDDSKSRLGPSLTLSSSLTSVRDDDTLDVIYTRLSQCD